MSARREKRLRKLEARVAYLEARTYDAEIRNLKNEDYGERIEALERIAANPVMIISDPNVKAGRPSFLERLRKRLKLWKFKRAYMRPDVTPEEVEKAFESWKKGTTKFEAVLDQSNLNKAYKMSLRGKRWKNYSHR